MGWGVSFLVRRARSSWLLLACVAVMVLVATGLATVLWTFAAGAIPAGALSILAAPQVRLVALSGAGRCRQGRLRLAGHPGYAGQGLAGGRFPDGKRAVGGPGPALVYHRTSVVAPGGSPGAPCHQHGHRADPARVAGRDQRPGDADRRDMARSSAPWPSGARGTAGRRGQPAARDRGLGADGHPQSGGAPTSLQVTGLFRPTNPASPYWALDLLPISGISIQGSSLGYARAQPGAPRSATARRW